MPGCMDLRPDIDSIWSCTVYLLMIRKLVSTIYSTCFCVVCTCFAYIYLVPALYAFQTIAPILILLFSAMLVPDRRIPTQFLLQLSILRPRIIFLRCHRAAQHHIF